MLVNVRTTLLGSMAELIKAALDAGEDPGTVQFYTAPVPDDLAAITTQTLLGTLVLSDPSGTVTDNALTLGTIADDEAADATGTPVWARLADGDGLEVMDVDVGDEESDAVIKLNTTAIVAGGPIKISSFVITVG